MECCEKVEMIEKSIRKVMEDDENENEDESHRQQLLLLELEWVKHQEQEKILKEVKEIKRQNRVTHCLLTALIVITLTWQLSEVSLIFTIKQALNNPLKSVGGLLKGFIHRGRQQVQDQTLTPEEEKHQHLDIPPLKIPHLDFLPLDH